eukprot:4510719-Pleurochrysis_carterae.AAC.6
MAARSRAESPSRVSRTRHTHPTLPPSRVLILPACSLYASIPPLLQRWHQADPSGGCRPALALRAASARRVRARGAPATRRGSPTCSPPP